MYVFKCLGAFVQIISPTTLFLAAKVEEQPRKLEHVIKVAHACLNPQEPPLDTKSNVSSGSSACCMVESFFSLSASDFPVLSVVMVSLCITGCTKFPCPLQRTLFSLPWPTVGVYQTPTPNKAYINSKMSLFVWSYWPFEISC